MNKKMSFGAAIVAALFLFSGTVISMPADPLYLYVAPSKGGKPGGGQPGSGKPTVAKTKKPADSHEHSIHDHGGGDKKKMTSRYGGGKNKGLRNIEPSMRPMTKRSYILSSAISDDATAHLLLADGTAGDIKLILDKKQSRVAFETPRGDGPAHGANNVYVVDKNVEDGTLYIRTAKWISMHHSCGWGHKDKYNEERIGPRTLDSIPLDIKIDNLWSGNLHDAVYSGNMLEIEALHYGKAAAGTNISVTTDQKWTKRLRTNDSGKTSFRLIEDYFSDDWGKFKRRNKRAFSVVAKYELNEAGEHRGEKYNKVKMVTTLHWKYSPSKKGYESYSAGLYAGIFTIGIGGLGMYFRRLRRKNPLRDAGLDEES